MKLNVTEVLAEPVPWYDQVSQLLFNGTKGMIEDIRWMVRFLIDGQSVDMGSVEMLKAVEEMRAEAHHGILQNRRV